MLVANARIAPLWDNLRTSGGAGLDVYVEELADQATIRWQAALSSDGSDVNGSVTLYDDGRIQFHFGPGNTNLSPTIGISRGNGLAFSLAPYDGAATLTNANSIELKPLDALRITEIGAYEFEGSSLDLSSPTIVTTDPSGILDGAVTEAVEESRVDFGEPVNPIAARSPANYELRDDGGDGVFGNSGDRIYALDPVYHRGDTFVTPRVIDGPLPAGQYQLSVFGSTSIHDLAGLKLDGDGDGDEGGDFIRSFTVSLPPQVEGVSVSASTWTPEFRGALDGETSGSGHLLPDGGPAQLTPLPWPNLNQIHLRLSKVVAITAGDLSINSTDGSTYDVSDFNFDPTTQTAVWTLDAPLNRGTISIELSDDVRDTSGLALDGEWNNPASVDDAMGDTYPSGDGEPGGAFAFSFNVALGDIDRDGAATIFDIAALRRAAGSAAGSSDYSVFADLDGDGEITAADAIDLRSHLGHTLTTSDASAASPSAPALASVAPTDSAAIRAARIAAWARAKTLHSRPPPSQPQGWESVPTDPAAEGSGTLSGRKGFVLGRAREGI